MNTIGYYIALPFIYGISLLPYPLLYLFSDFLYLILYRIAAYRRDVVYQNLKKSFPEKSEQQLKNLENKFYHYFFDLMLETIKTLSISSKSVLKRVKFDRNEAFKHYAEKNQSVIIVMGHYGNWELAGARFSQDPYHRLYVIYHPLKNKYFDQLVYHMRTRLGNKLYAMNESFRGMVRDRNELTATAFIADQTPSPKGAYWTNFLNQDTPVFVGTAKIARKLNYPVVYVSVHRLKRGYYELKGEILIDDPGKMSEDEISEIHTKRLEQDINEEPYLWLWTHRRWKHKRPVE